jgi:N-acetylglucosamine-6-phosphate deacetylase
MYLRGNLVLPDRILKNGLLQVEGGRITAVWDEPSAPPVRAGYETDGYICPGFIDLHCHGGGGADFMHGTAEAVETIAYTHGRHGTTGLFCTTLTAPPDAIRQAVRAARGARTEGARILGYHIEGPFISLKMKGAQNGRYVRPADRSEIETWLVDGGREMRWHITIAPEIDGHLEAIAYLKRQGFVVSAGHTDATLAELQAGVAAGVSHCTHLFNAMRPMHHRDPGTAGGCLGLPQLTVELIGDGIHVHPLAMKVAIAAKGADRTALVTDAMEAVDMPEGDYHIWELDVTVRDGSARLKEGGGLAGSLLTMDRGVANLVNLVGLDLPTAVRMASTVPARIHGLAQKGRLAPGCDADIAVLGPDFVNRLTVVAGQIVYREE